MEKLTCRRYGFTFIELMITISIIAIVSALGMATNFRAAQRTARDGRRKSDLEQLRSALELSRTDLGQYPENLEELLSGGYLNIAIEDPKYPDRQYYYERQGDTYVLCAAMERGGEGSAADCGDCVEACNYAAYSPGRVPPTPPAVTSTPTAPPGSSPTPTPVSCTATFCGDPLPCSGGQVCDEEPGECMTPLARNQSDCDCDANCQAGLVCYQNGWDYCCYPGEVYTPGIGCEGAVSTPTTGPPPTETPTPTCIPENSSCSGWGDPNCCFGFNCRYQFGMGWVCR